MKFIHIVTIFEHHMLIKGTGVFIPVNAPHQMDECIINNLRFNRTDVIINFFNHNTTSYINEDFSALVFIYW
ncbi:hypothetical protein HR52_05435 [Aeromonas hydrophila]|nr:hypothetical protein HR52_05435 [Aeromonas hydrophila]OCA67581.1 hypothetical protein A9R12_02785 [Aeromonas hydrophila]TNI64291.1 hypothetical protein CF124_17880 [Aeromonas hydrophila]